MIMFFVAYHQVLPAYAGMILNSATQTTGVVGAPRVCGDDLRPADVAVE